MRSGGSHGRLSGFVGSRWRPIDFRWIRAESPGEVETAFEAGLANQDSERIPGEWGQMFDNLIGRDK